MQQAALNPPQVNNAIRYHRGTMPDSEYDAMMAALKQPVSLAQCMQYFEACLRHTADMPHVIATPSDLATTPKCDHGTMDRREYESFLEKLKQPMPQHQYMRFIERCYAHNALVPQRIIPQDEVTLPIVVIDATSLVSRNDYGTSAPNAYQQVVSQDDSVGSMRFDHPIVDQSIKSNEVRPTKFHSREDTRSFVMCSTWPTNVVSAEELYSRFVRETSSDKSLNVLATELRECGYIVGKKRVTTPSNGQALSKKHTWYTIDAKYVKS